MIPGLVLAIAAIFSLSQPMHSAQSSTPPPFIGTWKYNPEKSTMNLSLPPKSLTRTYEDRGGGVYIYTQTGFSPDGSKLFSLYVAKDDGATYPLVVEGADNLSSISIKAIDAYTAEQHEGANATGGGGTRATRTVSQDGRTLTLTIRRNPGGEDAAPPDPNEVNIMVFERQ